MGAASGTTGDNRSTADDVGITGRRDPKTGGKYGEN